MCPKCREETEANRPREHGAHQGRHPAASSTASGGGGRLHGECCGFRGKVGTSCGGSAGKGTSSAECAATRRTGGCRRGGWKKDRKKDRKESKKKKKKAKKGKNKKKKKRSSSKSSSTSRSQSGSSSSTSSNTSSGSATPIWPTWMALGGKEGGSDGVCSEASRGIDGSLSVGGVCSFGRLSKRTLSRSSQLREVSVPAWVHQFTGLSGIRDVKEVLTLAEILDSASRRETARALHPLPADPGHPGCRDEGRKLGEGGAGEHAEVPGQQQYACIDKRLIKRFRQGWNNRAALMKGTEGFGAFCTRSPRRWEPEHDAIAQRNGAEQPPPSSELDLSRVGWWPQYVQFFLRLCSGRRRLMLLD